MLLAPPTRRWRCAVVRLLVDVTEITSLVFRMVRRMVDEPWQVSNMPDETGMMVMVKLVAGKRPPVLK
jgi:hypothetical protein